MGVQKNNLVLLLFIVGLFKIFCAVLHKMLDFSCMSFIEFFHLILLCVKYENCSGIFGFTIFCSFLKVMVSAKEEPNVPISPAMDGLLRVHKQIFGSDDAASPAALGIKARLLVPGAQAASLIGKQGSTIKSIQATSGCIIRVLGAGILTNCSVVLSATTWCMQSTCTHLNEVKCTYF